MTTSLRDEVIAYIREKTGAGIGTYTPDDTALGDGLGIDGADGWELIDAFGEAFGIDLSTFDADKHFGPECDPITGFVYFVLWRGLIFGETPRFLDLVPITLRDLVRAAEMKRWPL